jgi:outer membrane protein assembly factor BamB
VVVTNVQGIGTVSVLSPEDGATVWSASTNAVAGIWCAVDTDGAVVALSGYGEVSPPTQTTLTAFEPGGAMRWQEVLPGDVYYRGTIDASGQLLLASSAAFALDMATGATRWKLPPPSASCMWPMTMSTAGTLYGMQCDGTFFAAGD